MKKYSFPPIVNKQSKVLVLGTMPGDKSLKMNEYYANPQNQFWKIVAAICNSPLPTDYESKKAMLLKNKIAIWDVLMHCERTGSLDQAINKEFPNDFKSFYTEFPRIKAIFFNGSKADNFYKTHNLFDSSKIYKTLPSTSSTNTSMTLENKFIIWNDELKKYI